MITKNIILFYLLVLQLVVISCSSAKRQERASQSYLKQDVIAASQAGASPLFFDPGKQQTPLFTSVFNHEGELLKRNGIPNFIAKARQQKPLTVAFIGGSVTQMENKYRNQAARYIRDLFPGTPIRFINAGVSGTGTDLGACRLQEQVLQHHPDLIFIDFAVNGSGLPGLEGMIRKTIRNDPATDICLLYAISTGQDALYADGKMPPNIVGLETVGDYYGLPAIHLGLEPSLLVAQGKLLFKPGNPASALPVFSDGTHPTEYGGYVYAGAIRRSIQKMEAIKPGASLHRLPPPMIADNWEDAVMLAPGEVIFGPGWKKIDPLKEPNLSQFASWFPYIMSAGAPGSYFSFSFRGSRIGIFDIGGPEVGQLDVFVDGKRLKTVNRFSSWCNNRYRGQYELVNTGPGLHEVRMAIAREIPDKRELLGPLKLADITANPAKYDHSAIYLGKILLKGELVKK